MQFDLDYAYNYCKEISIRHYENFPVGSLLIPKNKRKYIYSIYAFARFADDIADSEKFTEDVKLRKLNDLDNELNKIISGDSDKLIPETENIFFALSNTISELKIPVDEFRDLLIAFRQDAVKQRYNEFDELLEYSKYSANPIGHLVLYTFGYNRVSHKDCFIYSDFICTALQLTNFWQDVSVDLKINRIYIPLSLMKENNYDENMLNEKIENDDFRNVIHQLVMSTRNIFEKGNVIINCVTGRLKLELKATIAGGNEILNKIEDINYNVLSKRVKLNNFDKVKLLGAIIWK